MKKVEHALLTEKYTKIYHEDEITNNAPHHFVVLSAETDPVELAVIDFQEGPIKEAGVNGVANEDLIVMALIRLQSFQNSPFACKENAMAITKLEETLLWLRKRTMGREQQGIEGTHEI